MSTIKKILESDESQKDLLAKYVAITDNSVFNSNKFQTAKNGLERLLNSINTNKRYPDKILARVKKSLEGRLKTIENRFKKLAPSQAPVPAPTAPAPTVPAVPAPFVFMPEEYVGDFNTDNLEIVKSDKKQTIIKVDMKKILNIPNIDLYQYALDAIPRKNIRNNVSISLKMVPYNVRDERDFDINNLEPAGKLYIKSAPPAGKNVVLNNHQFKFSVDIPAESVNNIEEYLNSNINNREFWKAKSNLTYVNRVNNIPNIILDSIKSIKESNFGGYKPYLYIVINNVEHIDDALTHQYLKESTDKSFHCVFSPIKKWLEDKYNDAIKKDYKYVAAGFLTALNKINNYNFEKGYPLNDPVKCKKIMNELLINITVVDLFLNPVHIATCDKRDSTIRNFVYQVDGLNHVEAIDLKAIDQNIHTLIEAKKMRIIKKSPEELIDLYNDNEVGALKYVNNNDEIKKLVIKNTMFVLDSIHKNPFNKVVREIHPDFSKYSIETRNNPVYDFINKSLSVGSRQLFQLGYENLDSNTSIHYVKEIDHETSYLQYADCDLYAKYGLPTVLSTIIKYAPALSINDIKKQIDDGTFMTGFYTINNVIIPNALHDTIRKMDLVNNNCCYTSVDIEMFVRLGYEFDIYLGVYSRNKIELNFNEQQLKIIKARPGDIIELIEPLPTTTEEFMKLTLDEITDTSQYTDEQLNDILYSSGEHLFWEQDEFGNTTKDNKPIVKPRNYCTGLGCWSYVAKNEIIYLKVKSFNDAYTYAAVLKDSNRSLSISVVGNEYIRIEKPQSSHKNHSHMYSYILAYSRVNLINQILKFDEKDICGIHLDSVLINSKLSDDIIQSNLNKHYRVKNTNLSFMYEQKHTLKSGFQFHPIINSNTYLNIAVDSNDELLKPFILISGAGGCGKTQMCINTFSKSSTTIISYPSNQLRANKHKEICDLISSGVLSKHCDIKNSTWQALGVGRTQNGTKPLDKHSEYPNTLIVDECSMISKQMLAEIIEKYTGKCNQIILLADIEIDYENKKIHYYQIPNMDVGGKLKFDDTNTLLKNIHQIKLSKSYRFKEQDPINKVCDILRDEIKNGRRYDINKLMQTFMNDGIINIEDNITKQSELKKYYTIDDTVLTARISCKHCNDSAINCPKKHLCTAKIAMYTNMLWDDENNIKKWYVTKQHNRKSGVYYKSTIIDHDIGPATCCKRLSYTCHSMQGCTIKNGSIFIDCIGSDLTVLYTSISRATSMSQIKFIQSNV